MSAWEGSEWQRTKEAERRAEGGGQPASTPPLVRLIARCPNGHELSTIGARAAEEMRAVVRRTGGCSICGQRVDLDLEIDGVSLGGRG